jgi:hypothetical protein
MRITGGRRNLGLSFAAKWLSLLFLATITATSVPAMAQGGKVIPFKDFLASLKSARAASFVGRTDAKLQDAGAFAQMRAHLLGMYDGVSAARSFALDGQIFDCIPRMQQPSVRQLGLSGIATPPPTASGDTVSEDSLPAAEKSVDAFGNARQCAAGTIPMRRITLQELSHYRTLAEFFRKYPPGAMQDDSNGLGTSTSSHRWAHAYDFPLNWGGEAVHSVFRPAVRRNLSEVFSLSQQWYSGKLSTTSPVQTAEVGWQVYPAKWGNLNPTVFIYWTRDDYKNSGCYNLDCAGFVQVSSGHPLGAVLRPPGVVGGEQREEYFAYRLYQGGWWVAVGPTKAKSVWVGYYPTKIYGRGQMYYYATEIDIGGETVGTTRWPGMGSGQWATRGFQYAAYDRNIQYRDSNNRLYAPQLTAVTNGANAYRCYAITTPNYTSSWLTYFYFGGPGGTKC